MGRTRVLRIGLVLAAVVCLPTGVDAQAILGPVSTLVEAEDGFKLRGLLHAPALSSGDGVLLLQPCGDFYTQADYAGLSAALSERGFYVMTFDPRGVGASADPGDSRAEQGLNSESDNDRVFGQFESHPMVAEVRAIVGASCNGATAASMASTRPQVEAIVLLSGGINSADAESALARRQVAVFGVGSESDVLRYRDQESGDWVETDASAWVEHAVVNSGNARSVHRSYTAAGHALAMFDAEPALAGDIADWVASTLRE